MANIHCMGVWASCLYNISLVCVCVYVLCMYHCPGKVYILQHPVLERLVEWCCDLTLDMSHNDH